VERADAKRIAQVAKGREDGLGRRPLRQTIGSVRHEEVAAPSVERPERAPPPFGLAGRRPVAERVGDVSAQRKLVDEPGQPLALPRRPHELRGTAPPRCRRLRRQRADAAPAASSISARTCHGTLPHGMATTAARCESASGRFTYMRTTGTSYFSTRSPPR